MKRGFVLFFSLLLIISISAQRMVKFYAEDGLAITADVYVDKPSDPYIVLFHQGNSSRGEYRDIAPKLMRLGYNSIAVDLRSGGESNYVSNETFREAKAKNLSTDYLSAIADINAAINYAFVKNGRKPVVVMGSSFSSSLLFMISEKNPSVKAVIAFSPGEYFGNQASLKDSLDGFDKPAFVSGANEEAIYWKEIFPKKIASQMVFFVPQKKSGKHGAMSLWDDCEAKTDYWIELMLFIRKFN